MTARAFLLGLLALGSLAGCDRPEEGVVKVVAIGGTPAIVDPAGGPLDAGKAVLLGNAAQGLVRFDALGNIEPGLAERWNVSDDGLSYIFRVASGTWPDGRKISAGDVARLLRRQLARQSRNPLKDTVGAVAEIVAMTDRVIEIRLLAARPHLLQVLAQPEFALVRERQGTGPFRVKERRAEGGGLRLERELPAPDGEEPAEEEVVLAGGSAAEAVKAFSAGTADLVLGGTFADLGVALAAPLPRGTLRFDPAAGLFGLVPARQSGPLAELEVRVLLDQAIDRGAIVTALGVPDLEARTSILQPALDGVTAPALPEWAAVPVGERQAALMAEARRLFGEEPPTIRIALPEGPGTAILLGQLRSAWAPLGVTVEPAGNGNPADLRLVDLVAPSISPAWFLRQFRCEFARICSEDADELLDAARVASVPQQRAALFAEAERIMRQAVLFMPIAAPVRWSLVGRGIPGFAENRFARHTLTGLRQRLPAQRRE